MRCIIIEDEPLAQDVLIKYINDHPMLQLKGVFDDALSALNSPESRLVDLIFLDINLPKLSGINFYKALREKPQVIFTTAYSEYAVEGFELEATDYLLKPISFDRFMAAVSKALEKKTKNPQGFLHVKTDKKYYRVPYPEIKFISSIGDFVKIHTPSQTYISNLKLRQLEELLPSDEFIRIHKSHIVSISAINFLEGNQVQVEDQKLPVGYAYRATVDQLFRG